MNTPRRESRRTVKDTTLRGSAFNPEWVDRVSRATLPQYDHEPVRGYTDKHTEILRRVCAASEAPELSWDERGKYWREVVEDEAKKEAAKYSNQVNAQKEQETEWEMDRLADKTLYSLQDFPYVKTLNN